MYNGFTVYNCILINNLCNTFVWYTVKYQPRDLIFLSMHKGECVNKEKCSHSWDVCGIPQKSIA